MKTLMLVLALVLTAQAQKTTYDKFTETTEVTSDRITVSQSGYTIYLTSFVTQKKGEDAISGLTIRIFSARGWYPSPEEKVLYVIANERRYQYRPSDTYLGSTMTTLLYTIDSSTLKTILSSNLVEMKVGDVYLKLKEKQVEKLRKPGAASSVGKT